jgi:hypothetical protein
MTGLRKTAGRCSAILAFSSAVIVANAATFPYVSCVGKQWQPMRVQASVDGGVCARNDHTEVCRRPAPGGGNVTSKVTLRQDGMPAIEWSESGDPSYLDRMLVLGSAGGELVVATLQSESQGMAMRDWQVTYVHPAATGTLDAMHTWSAEFGSEGALVRPAHAGAGPCALLVSEWTSRQTQQGERLFLKGRLRFLGPSGFGAPIELTPEVRFDDRIKRLRERDDPRIPLSLFEGRR